MNSAASAAKVAEGSAVRVEMDRDSERHTPDPAMAVAPPLSRNGSSTRLDAVAKLRRAASQREVKKVSPHSSRLRAEGVPRLPTQRNDAETATPQQMSPQPWLEAPGEVQRSLSTDHLTMPTNREASPLPSLDQLRRKILQERKSSGLARSASASASSRVARAYTMQKLMGATTPVPYNDMFAFVRSVNEARSAEISDTSQVSAEVSMDSDLGSVPDPTDSSSDEMGLPRMEPKRSTLMRSVSAREVARKHMIQRIIRQDRSESETAQNGPSAPQSGTTSKCQTPEPLPPPAPAIPLPYEAASGAAAPPHTGSSLRRTHMGTAVLSAFSDDSGSTHHTDSVYEPLAWTSASGPASGSVDEDAPLSSASFPFTHQLDAEAREVRARRLHGAGAGYLAPAVQITPTTASTASFPYLGDAILGSAPRPEMSSTTTRAIPPALPSTEKALPSIKPLPSLPHLRRMQTVGAPRSPALTAGLAEPWLSTRAPSDRQIHMPPAGLSSGFQRPSSAMRSASGTERPTFPPAPSSRSASAPLATDRDPEASHTPAKKEGRGARLLGSLRRKTSRSKADRARLHGVAQAERTHHAGIVCLQDEGIYPNYARVISLGMSHAQLTRICTDLALSGPAILARFPGEVGFGDAMDPPRRLQRVVPVLQTAGESYVKLRYLYIFSDILLLVKPAAAPTDSKELSAYMVRKLHAPPDLHDVCAPVSVLPLRHARLLPSFTVQAAHVEADRQGALYQLLRPGTPFVPTLQRVAQELGHASEAHAQGYLLYHCPELDRAAVSHYLFDRAQRAVLEAYMAQYPFRGLSLEAAVRLVLLDLHFPSTRADFDVVIMVLAGHWLRANHVQPPASFPLSLATNITRTLLALNDALHLDSVALVVPGLFSRANPTLGLSQFVQAVREQDIHHLLSDRELGEMYLSIKTYPLLQAPTAGQHTRRVVLQGEALATGLVAGVPSASVVVAIDAPDPDFRIRLLGQDLYCDPPVLTFAHAATAEFTVCSTAMGQHDLVFLRLGPNAALYTGREAQGAWPTLPRSLALSSEAQTARPTLSLQYSPRNTPPTLLQLYLAEADAARSVVHLLQERMTRAHTLPSSTTREALLTLADRVLQTALLGDPRTPTGRHHTPTMTPGASSSSHAGTGQDLVRVVRENSLMHSVLGAPSAW